MGVKTFTKSVAFIAIAIAAFYYFGAQQNSNSSAGETVQSKTSSPKLSSEPSTTMADSDPQTVKMHQAESGELVIGSKSVASSNAGQEPGSQVVRHLGERLDPDTYVPEGAPELIAIGEKMDPDRVYPNSGAAEMQQVGERIRNVDTYLPEGAPEPQLVGERILSEDVY